MGGSDAYRRQRTAVKQLIVFRHGKSDWDAGSGSDHERPLNKRGRESAERMGRFLARVDQRPERVLTSSAVRARVTIELAAAAGDWKCPVVVTDALYGASPASVLGLVSECDDAIERLLLAGHEPTWSDLVANLTDGTPPVFPTAAMACLHFRAREWQDVTSGLGQMAWLVTPKLLARAGFD